MNKSEIQLHFIFVFSPLGLFGLLIMSNFLLYKTLDKENVSDVIRLGHECIPVQYPDSYWEGMCNTEGMYNAIGVFNENDKLIGVCAVVKNFAEHFCVRYVEEEERKLLEKFKKASYISTIFVDPLYRKQGIAKGLIERQIEVMMEQKSDVLYLHVLVSNTPAISLYEKKKFQKLCKVENYYRDLGDNVRDAFLYFKDLHNNNCFFRCWF